MIIKIWNNELFASINKGVAQKTHANTHSNERN